MRAEEKKKETVFLCGARESKVNGYIAHCSSSHTLRLGRDPKPFQDQAPALMTSESYV